MSTRQFSKNAAEFWRQRQSFLAAKWNPPTFRYIFLSVAFNPFLLTGQFLAPKLIILIKCLIDILFFSVVLMFLYVEKDVNLA